MVESHTIARVIIIFSWVLRVGRAHKCTHFGPPVSGTRQQQQPSPVVMLILEQDCGVVKARAAAQAASINWKQIRESNALEASNEGCSLKRYSSLDEAKAAKKLQLQLLVVVVVLQQELLQNAGQGTPKIMEWNRFTQMLFGDTCKLTTLLLKSQPTLHSELEGHQRFLCKMLFMCQWNTIFQSPLQYLSSVGNISSVSWIDGDFVRETAVDNRYSVKS